MMKFLKDNWFRIIILLLSILLVSSVINYINTATRYTVQKQNFSIFKWYIGDISGVENISEGKMKILDILLERFGL